jgi:hypothetical protein
MDGSSSCVRQNSKPSETRQLFAKSWETMDEKPLAKLKNHQSAVAVFARQKIHQQPMANSGKVSGNSREIPSPFSTFKNILEPSASGGGARHLFTSASSIKYSRQGTQQPFGRWLFVCCVCFAGCLWLLGASQVPGIVQPVGGWFYSRLLSHAFQQPFK